VGIYARMSDNRQENSIDRQLSQVRPYVEKKGYTLIGEPYTDEGIAGDVFDKRSGFQRLLRDARDGLFDVIVTDEWSRLSRQDPVDFIAQVVKPLKDAGVTLDCVAEGPQRWDDLAQLILMTVKADKSQGESRTRSYRVLTGMRKAAAAGRLLSRACYGYVTEYETIQEPGKPPKTRPLRLVPDPRRAHVVRWMFERYVAGGYTMQDLAVELNQRAVESPPPAGKGGRASAKRKRGQACTHWTITSVRTILKNPRYTGALTWNRRSRGKYHHLVNGQAEPCEQPLDRPNAPEEWIVAGEPTHEALVSQDQFERAQERLRANKGTAPSIGAYLFSGLVTCSHCGRRLRGIMARGKRVYRCNKYDPSGNVVCDYNAVYESWLYDQVIDVIQQETLAPERIKALRDEARRQDDEERSADAVTILRKRLGEIEARIARGNETLLMLPPDRVAASIGTLRGWENERDQLRVEIARRQGEGGALTELDDAIQACEEMLWKLREAKEAEDDLLMRQIIREAVSRIELRWERRPYGTKTRFVVTGGVIHLYPQLSSPALHVKPCNSTTGGPSPAST
jgi:DNA invertase Pin-like site-specific DNA recombinase